MHSPSVMGQGRMERTISVRENEGMDKMDAIRDMEYKVLGCVCVQAWPEEWERSSVGENR